MFLQSSYIYTFSLGAFLLLAAKVLRRWRKKSQYEFIPGPPPSSVIGYLLDMHNPEGLDWHFGMPEKYGHVARLRGGLFGSDALYVTDPAALRAILVRDQNVFRESTEFAGLFGIIHHGDGVASVWGNEHKKQRRLMDPVFTNARISRLTPLFYNVAKQLRANLDVDIDKSPDGCTIDVLDRLTRASLELIAQGGLGHTFNSFDEDSQEFKRFHWAITSVLPLASGLFLVLPYLDYLRRIQPVWLRRFLANLLDYFPWRCARDFRKAVESMYPIYTVLFDQKKQVVAQGGIEALEQTSTGGRDLMTLLLKSNYEADEEDRLPDDVMIANIGSVVHGAQETTSSALARFLSLMVLNPDLQIRLRDEITAVKVNKGSDELDFYELSDLPLLDAVCREMLRVFAPVTFVWRQTMEDCIIPLTFPIHDPHTGKETKQLLIHKGTFVYLGLASSNRSTAIWGSDAAEFKPERWLGKSGTELTQDGTKLPGIFSNTMTFLGGGRACPGLRFALLEIKLMLSVLLSHYTFETSGDTVDWKLGITLTPYVRGDAGGPKVPIKIKHLAKSS